MFRIKSKHCSARPTSDQPATTNRCPIEALVTQGPRHQRSQSDADQGGSRLRRPSLRPALPGFAALYELPHNRMLISTRLREQTTAEYEMSRDLRDQQLRPRGLLTGLRRVGPETHDPFSGVTGRFPRNTEMALTLQTPRGRIVGHPEVANPSHPPCVCDLCARFLGTLRFPKIAI